MILSRPCECAFALTDLDQRRGDAAAPQQALAVRSRVAHEVCQCECSFNSTHPTIWYCNAKRLYKVQRSILSRRMKWLPQSEYFRARTSSQQRLDRLDLPTMAVKNSAMHKSRAKKPGGWKNGPIPAGWKRLFHGDFLRHTLSNSLSPRGGGEGRVLVSERNPHFHFEVGEKIKIIYIAYRVASCHRSVSVRFEPISMLLVPSSLHSRWP